MSGHQPKQLTELAFASFTAYMKDKGLQLLNWMKDSPTSIDEASKACRELKDFFHGTRIPPVLANEITKLLLTKLDLFSEIYEYTKKDCFHQILLPLVEVFMHPDVTSIELGPGYLSESDNMYCNVIMTVIFTKVGSLQNLKTLSVEFRRCFSLENAKLVLPPKLKELTLYGHNCCYKNSLKSIFECCRELKSFKTFVNVFPDISVPHLLKLNCLQTLHLLEEEKYWCVNWLDAAYVALINGLSDDTTSDILCASTLKSFGITLTKQETLHMIVDKLPHLTEIVLQHQYYVDISCLTQLKNLQSLTLVTVDRTSHDYKKILPVLGKSLVFLDLRNYKSLDVEFIGETCSNLRSLHVRATGGSETRPNQSLKSFPNFKTVECLSVNMYQDYDRTEFLIIQCVNVKVLSVVMSGQANIIENVLKRTSLTNLEELHLYPALRTEKRFIEELYFKCPNLRLVHGLGSDSFISGRVFDFHRCCESSCKFYGFSLESLVTDCSDDDDDSLYDDSLFGNPYIPEFVDYYTSESEST